MRPRNLTFFAIPKSINLDDLHLHANECRLKPVGPLELSSRGFITPMYGGEDIVESVDLSSITVLKWLTVGGEDRMLPSSVIADELQKKLAHIEETEGRKPGGRTRKHIKDELVHELLPKAFVKRSRVDACIVANMGFVAVDTASRKQAEGVVSEIRRALGSFPALPVNAEVSPRAILTGWLAGDAMPEQIALGSDVTLQDPTDTGAKVRITNMDLRGEDVTKHLEAGMQVTRLALVLEDKVSFELGEDLVVRKFKLLDAGDDGGVDDVEDLRAVMRANLFLHGFNVARVFDMIRTQFKLSEAG